MMILNAVCVVLRYSKSFFFFNDTATTEIYTLSLHDALPISFRVQAEDQQRCRLRPGGTQGDRLARLGHVREGQDAACGGDRKSTRLNSSHANISYAVFCLKKKKKLFIPNVLFILILCLTHLH